MSTTVTDEAVATYLNRLREELADLPPAEVEEILDDVGPQVAEVARELGEQDLPRRLDERLGQPGPYAAELRAAAGYPPRAAGGEPPRPSRRRTAGLRLALWLLVVAAVFVALTALAAKNEMNVVLALLPAAVLVVLSLVITQRLGGTSAVAELPEVRWLGARAPGGAVAEYGRLLQPGWWLVRAGVCALLLGALVGDHPSSVALLLVAVPLVLASVWLGRRSKADRRWLWVALPVNVLVATVLLGGSDRVAPVSYGEPGPPPAEPGYGKVLRVPAFGNIFPFDSDGNPLSGVFLYDESGRPITASYPAGRCLPKDRVPVPANRYPQPVYELGPGGACVPRSAVPTPSGLPQPPAPTTTPSANGATPTG